MNAGSTDTLPNQVVFVTIPIFLQITPLSAKNFDSVPGGDQP
jgi:hypothetical protein